MVAFCSRQSAFWALLSRERKATMKNAEPNRAHIHVQKVLASVTTSLPSSAIVKFTSILAARRDDIECEVTGSLAAEGFNMKAWRALAKLIWLSVLFMLSFQCLGCVSIIHSGSNCGSIVSNCGDQTNACDPIPSMDCSECCDRPELAEKMINRLRTAADWTQERRQRTSLWFLTQRERCGAVKASVCDWANEKKAEANAPPWPRFHPVPTRPVFEPDQGEQDVHPEVYGRFGKG